jgi:hypothetical protein
MIPPSTTQGSDYLNARGSPYKMSSSLLLGAELQW